MLTQELQRCGCGRAQIGARQRARRGGQGPDGQRIPAGQ